MKNFSIEFLHSPWWLLLLIPSLLLTIIPYLRLSKKYRKTRNRICSMVLHSLIMIFATCILSGMVFYYEKPNVKNELILLVDVSKTEDGATTQRDEFVRNVLYDCEGGGFKVGVVTFGFDQEYAVPLTTDIESIYKGYRTAELPDTNATNIAAALEYAQKLFENPETAKILLITDGKETDEEAEDVIRSVAAKGIKVDTAYIASENTDDDAQVTGLIMPNYHFNIDEQCSIGVTVESNVATTATVVFTDRYLSTGSGEPVVYEQEVELVVGEQTVYFEHAFAEGDLHQLSAKVAFDVDALDKNDEYSTYLYMQIFKKILIIERIEGESAQLMELLNKEKAKEEQYEIEALFYQSESIPRTAEGLCKYDQVILNNISNPELKSIVNNDTKETFDVILEEYVSEYGGGLFTVGGNNEADESNVYNKDTMYGTYQQMLPVESIEYTPPVGIMLIVDVSGSMKGDPLEDAVIAAKACVNATDVFSERDYVGVMTLDTYYGKILSMTPMTQRRKIESALDGLLEVNGGGTKFSEAIHSAAQELKSIDVAKRHIVIVTDGGVAGDDWEKTKAAVDGYHKEDNITVTVIGIGMGDSIATQMKELAEDIGGGKLRIAPAGKPDQVTLEMRNDFQMQSIEAVNDEESFAPIISMMGSPLVQGLARDEELGGGRMTVKLDGYYGVKIKPAAELILTANYGAPLYAQWKYGNGMVGAFMCDLQGVWSSEFMLDENGIRFIDKVVKNLMPVEDISPSDIRLEIAEDNYTNKLHVYTALQEGDYIDGEIIMLNSDGSETETRASFSSVTSGSVQELREKPCYVSVALSNNYSRAEFVVRQSGVYKIVVAKYNAANELVSTAEMYKSFAYSEEYDGYVETEEEILTKIENLAANGKGANIKTLENPVEIFEGFVTRIGKTFDPRYLFAILAIVCLLLDISVRKFKFKWPHELIRAYREKREEENKK